MAALGAQQKLVLEVAGFRFVPLKRPFLARRFSSAINHLAGFINRLAPRGNTSQPTQTG